LLRWFRGESNKIWEASENRQLRFILLAGFLIWTTVTLGFDAIVGRDLMLQVQAQSYPHVAGRILRSEVKPCHDGSDGTSPRNFEPDVEYAYAVNGIEHTGTQYRYSHDPMWRFSESAARSLLPKGEDAAVYYNPRDPADAILSPGLLGLDVLALLWLLPFNAVTLIGVFGYFQLVRYRATGGAAVWDSGRVVRAGGGGLGAAVGAIAAAGIVAFVLIFAIGIPTGGNPSVPVASFGWLIVLLAGGLAWLTSVRFLAKGTCDLVIDRVRQTLTLPVVRGRKEPLTIPWASLSAVEVEDTHDKSETVHYAVVAAVKQPDGTETRERVTDPQIESRANALAAWIRGVIPTEFVKRSPVT
jgi:hypothetical protein